MTWTAAQARYLQKTYGISTEDYDQRLANQGGVCVICGKRPGRRRLVVDHDHTTGAVRGLLHSRCNRALGPFESSPTIIARAIAYLQHVYFVRTGSTAP